MGELATIRWFRERAMRTPNTLVGIGDDCAVLAADSRPTLATTDMLLDGTHFVLGECGPRRAGRKALAVNLSDIAAMGGTPTAALVSLGLPRRGAQRIAEELFLGMAPLAERHATPIVGGDTNAWDGPLVVSVTLLGVPGPHGPILRSGARPGDWLFVTGPLGGSIRGKHLDFEPRLAEAAQIQTRCRPTAMIDLSDGVALDLARLAEESGVGAEIDAEAMPIADAAREMNDGRDALAHALSDGEDFELLFAASPEDGARLVANPPVLGLARIGVCVRGSGVTLVERGRRRPLAATGFEHRYEDER